MGEHGERSGFWSTLPGILTALAGIIGAISASYVAIKSIPASTQSTNQNSITSLNTLSVSTKEPTKNPNQVGGSTVLPPPSKYSVSGIWEYDAESQVSGAKCTNRLRLTMDGPAVIGVFDTCDHTGSGVEGTFQNNILEFSRNTGLATVQQFKLTKVNANQFSGRFWNEGKILDAGTIVIRKQNPEK